jgi:drug/metabolite transporter (DMT)-like permease
MSFPGSFAAKTAMACDKGPLIWCDCGGLLMLALSLGLFAAVCWSIHDLMARSLAPTLGAYRMSIFVMLIGFVLLSPAIFSSAGLLNGPWSELWPMIALGVTYGIAVSSLFKGFAMAPVSIVGPFTAGYPALIVIWGMVNGLEPSLLQVLAIFAILVGAVVVGRYGEEDGGLNAVEKGKLPLVIFFCVLASVCFAGSVIMGQNLSPRFGEIATAGMLRLPAALVLVPIAFREKGEMPKFRFSSWGWLVVMSLLDVSALTGVNYMGRLPGKEMGAMSISAYGGIAVLLAMIFLKEKVSLPQWFGIGLTVAGVAVLGTSV